MDAAAPIQCEECRLLFPSRDSLDNHQRHYCKGSEFHQRLMRKQQEAGLLSSEVVSAYLAGAPAPRDAGGLEGMTVEQLRARMARDAEIATVRKAEAGAEAERAAAHLAMQRAKAEAQQREAQARMLTQRDAELQARVQRRGAERTLRGAELHSEEGVRQMELGALREQERELSEQRALAEETVARVQKELSELHDGPDGVARRAQAELRAQELARPVGAHQVHCKMMMLISLPLRNT